MINMEFELHVTMWVTLLCLFDETCRSKQPYVLEWNIEVCILCTSSNISKSLIYHMMANVLILLADSTRLNDVY